MHKLLQEREQLWSHKQDLAQAWKKTLICITLRLPLEIRHEYPDLVQSQAQFFIQQNTLPIMHSEYRHGLDGPTWLAITKLDPLTVKQHAMRHEASSLGTFLDIDIFDHTGQTLDRNHLHAPQRSCLICDRQGRLCSKERRHDEQQLRRTLEQHMHGAPHGLPEIIAHLAHLAVEDELRTTDKPGLVTPCASGAHADMDFTLLLRSAHALKPFWKACAEMGQQYAHLPSTALFKRLRPLGMQAEKTMFATTQGINTHKGMIFGMGLLCAACGKVWQKQKPTTLAILQEVQKLCQGLTQAHFTHMQHATTHGENAFKAHGCTGARGEAEAGFPHVHLKALPALQKHAACSWHTAKLMALLHLMSAVQDTNIIHRASYEHLQHVQKQAHNILLLGELYTEKSQQALHRLQEYCLTHNLSSGGCADMLALSCFLYRLEHYAS